VEDSFLHKINLNALKNEVGIDSAEGIGNFLQMKNPKGVYNWAKDKSAYGSRPSYNDLVRLLEKGATVETLFGIDYSDRSSAPVTVPPEIMNDPAFREGLQESIKAKVDAVVSEQVTAILKAKGLI